MGINLVRLSHRERWEGLELHSSGALCLVRLSSLNTTLFLCFPTPQMRLNVSLDGQEDFRLGLGEPGEENAGFVPRQLKS